MEAKKIVVIKDWPKSQSVRNIQVFVGFANFSQRFIKSFSRIAALLTLILKTTESPNKLAPNRNDGSRSSFSKNNDNKPASGKNNGDSEVDGFGISRNYVEHAKKSRKLSKSGKSKNEKTFKS